MSPSLFEECLLINGSGDGDREVFSSIFIYGYATTTSSKINWILAKVVIFFIKGMLNFLVDSGCHSNRPGDILRWPFIYLYCIFR